VTVWNDGEFTWCRSSDRDCPQVDRCDLHKGFAVPSTVTGLLATVALQPAGCVPRGTAGARDVHGHLPRGAQPRDCRGRPHPFCCAAERNTALESAPHHGRS
jgi:hypothetical protein